MDKLELVKNLEKIQEILKMCISEFDEDQGSEKKSEKAKNEIKSIDFNMSIRAFVKKYGKKLSGTQKFVLIIAFLTKEDVSKEIELKTIKKVWNKMKQLLGKYNDSYSGRARENGWVNTSKNGNYYLLPLWKNCLK